jgi:hypothetical protein
MAEAEFNTFLQTYGKLAHRASIQNDAAAFADALSQWLSAIRNGPGNVPSSFEALLEDTNWDDLYDQVFIPPNAAEQTGRIEWPKEHKTKLGMQLHLAQKLADKEIDIIDWSRDFILHGPLNTLHTVTSQGKRLFVNSLVLDLRNHLSQETRKKAYAPAADRVVPLEHNSSGYLAAMDALDKASIALAQSNIIPDEIKEQRGAEFSAGRVLLSAKRVSVKAIKAVLFSALTYIGMTFAETAAGEAASHALQLIKVFLQIE